jgi:hypothetical protein
VAQIVDYRPFTDGDLAAAGLSLYVAFLHAPPTDGTRERVLALRSEVDDLQIHAREVYWLCRTKVSASPLFSRGLLEKAIAVRTTMRKITTVRKLAARYLASR